MKAAILFLVSAGALNAQITAVLNTVANRSPEVEIRNTSTVNMAALAIRMPAVSERNPDDTPMIVFVDAAVDQSTLPLVPNQTYSIPVRSRIRPGRAPEPLFQAPIVTAAIFADGSTAGDETLLNRLILRRCNMLQAIELAHALLSDAGRHNLPRAQLTDQFQALADSLNHWYLPPEQQVGRTLYQSLVSKLMNLPDLALGAPFPPTDFVVRETTQLNRQRTQLLASQPGLAFAAKP